VKSFGFKLGVLLAIVTGASLMSLVAYRNIVASLHSSLNASVGALETVHASENFHAAAHSMLTAALRLAKGADNGYPEDYMVARQHALDAFRRLAVSIEQQVDPDLHIEMEADPQLVSDVQSLFNALLQETDAVIQGNMDFSAMHIEKARDIFDDLFDNNINALHDRHEVRLETLKKNAHALSKRADLFFQVQLAILISSAIASVLFSKRVLMKGFNAAEKESFTDSLTGLKNRKYLDGPAMEEISMMLRSGRSFSLILVDIDYFKLFNDTFGHQAGDAALREAANQFHRSLRKTDTVIRYGGEEFLVILPGADKASALVTANKIRERLAVNDIELLNGNKERITASFGLASYPEEGIAAYGDLLERADGRLYEAKRSGRNRVSG